MADTEYELGDLITSPMEDCVFYNDLGIGEIEYYGEDMNTPIKPDEVWYNGYRIYPETFYQTITLKTELVLAKPFFEQGEYENDYISLGRNNSDNTWNVTIKWGGFGVSTIEKSIPLWANLKDFYEYSNYYIVDALNGYKITLQFKNGSNSYPLAYLSQGTDITVAIMDWNIKEEDKDFYWDAKMTLLPSPGSYVFENLQDIDLANSFSAILSVEFEVEYSYEMREKRKIRNTFKDVLTPYSTKENSGITANFNFSAANGEPFIGISLLYSFLTFYMYYIRADGTFFQVYADGWWLQDGYSTPEVYKTISYEEDSIKNQEFLDWYNQNII